jgi:cysteine rich repeat protein
MRDLRDRWCDEVQTSRLIRHGGNFWKNARLERSVTMTVVSALTMTAVCNRISIEPKEAHMDLRLSRFHPAIVLAALALECMGSANAQGPLETRLLEATSKIEAACGDDLKKYCSTVTSGEGRLLLCIEAHEDKITAKCDFALFQAERNLERALDRVEQIADACWNDIEKHCSQLPEGGGRIAVCLMSNRTSLTPACQTEIEKFQSRR